MHPPPITSRSPPRDSPSPPALTPDFSLTPAIFTPYTVPSTPTPATAQERLESLISTLNTHHDIVRRNMLFLIEQRGRSLVAQADSEIRIAQSQGRARGGELFGDGDGNGNGKGGRDGGLSLGMLSEGEAEAMRARLQAPRVNGAKSPDYQASPSTFAMSAPDSRRASIANTTPITSSTFHPISINNPSPGTMLSTQQKEVQIRRELIRAQQELVERGASEIQGYEAHARGVVGGVREVLEVRFGVRGRGERGERARGR